ncbi:MAG: riboflavin kinase, partial [Planctomycetota bacterium]
VYAAHAIIGQDRFDAAVHIGPSPTFDSGDETKVEAHLLDFEGDLYQQRLTLEFEDRIRPAKRFESSKQLVAQLHQDVALVTQLLRREPPKEI